MSLKDGPKESKESLFISLGYEEEKELPGTDKLRQQQT